MNMRGMGMGMPGMGMPGMGMPGQNVIQNAGPGMGGYRGPYRSVTVNGNPGYGHGGQWNTITVTGQPVGGYSGGYGQQHGGGYNPENMWPGGYGRGQGGYPQRGFPGQHGHGNGGGGPRRGGKKTLRDPPEKIAKGNLPEDGKECPVCYDAYYTPADGVAEAAVRIKSCGHVLGEKCLDDWIQQNNTCPVCRKEFPVNF